MKKSISLLLALLLLFSMSVVALAEGESWTCSNGHENPSDNLFCGKCGEKKPQEGTWTCSNGHENPMEHNFCSVCGEAHIVENEAMEQTDIAWRDPFENEEYDTALPLVQKASDNGDMEATAALATYYIYGYGETEKNYDKGLELAQKAADAGNARGMFLVGRCYSNGDGVVQDYEKAVEWYQKSADLGDPWAMNNLGVLYVSGSGVPQDYKKAAEWYEKAADLGVEYAMYSLAGLYRNGNGVPQDYKKAAEWYEKAADLGYESAMYSLACLYRDGNGVSQDYKKAAEWFVKAAELGNTGAMNEAGNAYHSMGEHAKAMEWYQKAVDAGETVAMLNIGNLYERGDGVEKSSGMARSWFYKAAKAGWITDRFLKGYWSTNNGMHTFEMRENGSYTTTIPVVPNSGDTYEIYGDVLRSYFASNPEKKTDEFKINVISESEIEIYAYQTKTNYRLIWRR